MLTSLVSDLRISNLSIDCFYLGLLTGRSCLEPIEAGKKLLGVDGDWENGFNGYYYKMPGVMSSLSAAMETIERDNLQASVLQKEPQIKFKSAGRNWRGLPFAKNFAVILEGKFIAKYRAKYLFTGSTSNGYRFYVDGRVRAQR